MAFVEGYLTGLALIVLIGPVLFVLLQNTFAGGRGPGLAVAFGIFVSDVVAVAICALGFARFLQSEAVQPWIAGGGGALLLGFGVRYLLAPAIDRLAEGPVTTTGLASAFVKGFLVNFVNPFVFAVWLGIIGAATARHGYDVDLLWFLTGAVLGILTLDVSKVLLAHRIRPLLAPRRLQWAFRISGVLLVGFGLRLLVLAVVG